MTMDAKTLIAKPEIVREWLNAQNCLTQPNLVSLDDKQCSLLAFAFLQLSTELKQLRAELDGWESTEAGLPIDEGFYLVLILEYGGVYIPQVAWFGKQPSLYGSTENTPLDFYADIDGKCNYFAVRGVKFWTPIPKLTDSAQSGEGE